MALLSPECCWCLASLMHHVKCLVLVSLCTSCLSSVSTRMSLVPSIFDASCEVPVTLKCLLLVSHCTTCFSSVSAGMSLMIFTVFMQSPEPQRWMTRMWPSRWSTAMCPKLWGSWMTSAKTQSECFDCRCWAWWCLSEWFLVLFLLGEILLMQLLAAVTAKNAKVCWYQKAV